MATATVVGLHFQELSDYSDETIFGMNAVERVSQSPTRVDRMITGRLIAIESPGSVVQWSVTLPYVTRTDAEWLRTREGDTFYMRTDYGDAFFATLNALSMSEELLPGTPSTVPVGSISLVLTEVTLTVAV